MKKIWVILFFIFVAVAIFWLAVNWKTELKKFQEIDFVKLAEEIKDNVINPPPLRIENPFKDTVLESSKIFDQTNLQRYENGKMPALERNNLLDKAALAKAKDMFERQYFDHVSPSGVAPSQLVKSYGYNYIVTGENLILGNFDSEKELVQAWMNSHGHRANILNKRYAQIGVAVVKGIWKGETTWIGVQEFGLPLSSCKQPDELLKNNIDISKQQLDRLSLQIDQKNQDLKTAQDNQDYEKYNALVPEYNNLVSQYQNLANVVKNVINNYNSQVAVFNKCATGQ